MGHIVTRDKFPHGLRCMDCEIEILPGAEYEEDTVSYDAPTDKDIAWTTEVVCPRCYTVRF